jgi:uncharacterized phiE125 gp8 family phage protein
LNTIVLIEPLFEPVSVEEAFVQLRLGDPKSEDVAAHPFYSMIQRNIRTAREQVELMTNRALVEQTLRATFTSFPCAGRGLQLLRQPVIRVLSVVYYDASNDVQLVDEGDWYLTDDRLPHLRFVDGWASPSIYTRGGAVRVDYVAGYGGGGSPVTTQEEAAANVPASLKDAVLIGVEILQGAMSPADRQALEAARASLVSGYTIHTV